MSNMFRAENSPPIQNPKEQKMYAPISVGGYLGIFLLMLLPGVNMILLVVWACGGARKVNLKNFARAALIVLFFAVVLFVIAWLMFGSFWTRLIENMRYYW